MGTGLSEAQTALPGATVRRGAGRRRFIWATAVLAALLTAALALALFMGGAGHTAKGLVRALSEGDGRAASELLPERVLSQIAGETGTGVEQARAGVENALKGLVSVYGGAPGNVRVTAGDRRELTGGELAQLQELYGQIGLKLDGAAGVDVDIDAGNGAAGTVPVTVIKLGMRWYADYTSLDDTAYRIAYLGK